MENNEKQNWTKDFTEFVSIEESSVPQSLNDNVQNVILDALNPSGFKVFVKLSLITFIVGFITLLFCPQFGISLTSSMGLMHYLMPFGDAVCMISCGGLFAGSSVFVASLVLLPEEVLRLKKHFGLQLASLSILSVGTFLCVGGDVVFTLGLIWAFGAIMGGAVSLESGWRLRKAFLVRV
jgi:hypothetical protein